MAEGGSKKVKGSKPAPPPEILLDSPLGPQDLVLPIELPAAMFTGPGLLTLADLLPVMTAYVDRDLTYRFINKPLAEWLGWPRREMIGRPMREVIGDEAFVVREPMIEAALAGERKLFAATFN